MPDLINFTLPSIDENTDAKTMKQIKNYLFQLTEQMKFYLNNIDADNFTDAYNLQLSNMASSQTTNSNQMSATQQQLKAFENKYNYTIKNAVDKISGNSGGYIVTLDTNGDGLPDDLRILSDTSNYITSKKYWQFNRAGLAHIEIKNGETTSNLALDADGNIIGERIVGELGEYVTLNACTLNACTGNFSGTITAAAGKIGNFYIADEENAPANVYKGGLFTDYTDDKVSYRTFIQSAYRGGENDSPENTWLFSAQKADVVDGVVGQYGGLWYVTASGDMMVHGKTECNNINDLSGDNLIGWVNNDFVIGCGSRECDTNISTNNNYAVRMCFSSKHNYFRFMYYDDIYEICVPKNLSIFANSGKGNIKLNGTLYIATHVYDTYGHGIVNISDTNFVLGLDKYNNNLNTYLEGGTVFLRHNEGGVEIQQQSATRVKIYYPTWTFSGIDSTGARRDTIETKGGFVLSANEGNNSMYLLGSKIYIIGDADINGDLKISWFASSGMAPLYVNSKGIVVCSTSSERYKENITDNLEEWLNPERLYNLPVVQYNYKKEFKDNELVAGTQIGIKAEDVEVYYPNALIRNVDGQAESWQDRIMIPAMLKLLQNQKKEIDCLKQEIILLDEKINSREIEFPAIN